MVITNVTQGTTLFSDNFEGLGTSVSHSAYPDNSGDFDPTGGSPGSWSVGESAQTGVQVTDYATPGQLREATTCEWLAVEVT